MIEEIIEMLPIIAAILTVIFAGILWKVVLGISFISGYGVGQRGDNNMEKLFIGDVEKVPTPQRAVVVVSGNLHRDHWTQESWIRWLEKVHKEKNITTKIVTGPRNDKESMGMIKELLEKGAIELKKLENKETMHFLIIDEDWAHIEEKHIGPKIPNGIRVEHLFPGPRIKMLRRFEMLWNKAKPITLENLENSFTSDNVYNKEIGDGSSVYPVSA